MISVADCQLPIADCRLFIRVAKVPLDQPTTRLNHSAIGNRQSAIFLLRRYLKLLQLSVGHFIRPRTESSICKFRSVVSKNHSAP